MKSTGTLLLLVVALGFCPTARATTWHVPSQCPTIQAGIDSASAGDTVLVACGTYYEHDILMKSGVYLKSETGDPNCVTIDAQEQGRVFYCQDNDSDTKIEGFTVVGGYAFGDGELPMLDDSGGGMLCLRASLSISNCIFQGNWAYTGGGAVVCDASAPQFAECTFTGNSVETRGGSAIYCGVSEARLMNCIFSDNHGMWGGAVFSDVSEMEITGCNFSGNTAQSGGALTCMGTTATIATGSTFSENSALFGGAVYYRGESSPAIQKCTFSANSATIEGGAIFCRESSPTIQECTFSGNSATENGGAIFCRSGSSLGIQECTFSGNSATDEGGAISGILYSSISLGDCQVSENSANAGAGVSWHAGSATVENSTFFGNVAVNTGGGLFALSSSVACAGNTFSANLANNTYGGAICLSHHTSSAIMSCTVARNGAPYGGGIHLETSATITLENSIVAFSTEGEAIHSWSGGGIVVECCDLFGNEGGNWVGWIANQYDINGNISEDPLFCNLDSGDFRLDCQSPCAPAQHPQCGLIGAWDVGCGGTATEKTTWSSLKALYR